MRRSGAAGFTLLEIAVALAILGVGIVSCLQIFSASLRMQDTASRQGRAVMHARVAMDALLLEVDFREKNGRCDDTAEGFRTCHVVRPCGPADGCDEGVSKRDCERALYYLEVDVTWRDGAGAKTYTLKTVRMATEDA